MSKTGFRFVYGVERPMQSGSMWKNMQMGLRRNGLLLALAAVFLFHSFQGTAQQLAPVYVMNTVAGTGGTSYEAAPYTGDGPRPWPSYLPRQTWWRISTETSSFLTTTTASLV